MYPRLTSSALLAIYLLTVAACSPGSNRSSVAPPAANQARPVSSPAEGSNPTGPSALVKSVRANLRDKPSRSGGTVTTLGKGKRLVVIEKAKVGPWYRVRETSTGESGWIHGNTITLVQDTPTVRASQEQVSTTQAEQPRSPSGSGRSYINVDGVRVRSPVMSDSPPPGASARCRDGSYSFSLNRRGTCSHHGGVAAWL